RQNDNFSPHLPPAIDHVVTTPPKPLPQQKILITADVSGSNSVKSVTLLYRILGVGADSPERELPMERLAGDERKGTYQAALDTIPEGKLVRYRVKAVDSLETQRFCPGENEPRPTFSFSTFANTNKASV